MLYQRLYCCHLSDLNVVDSHQQLTINSPASIVIIGHHHHCCYLHFAICYWTYPHYKLKLWYLHQKKLSLCWSYIFKAMFFILGGFRAYKLPSAHMKGEFLLRQHRLYILMTVLVTLSADACTWILSWHDVIVSLYLKNAIAFKPCVFPSIMVGVLCQRSFSAFPNRY